MRYLISLLMVISLAQVACKSPVKKQEDKIYSRHLQQHMHLTILATPLPEKAGNLNLLLLNDGQDMEKFHVREILDSLYEEKLVEPLVIVGIHASARMQDYGVAGSPDYQGNGSKAGKYAMFINNELYPYAKKKAGVRKFASVAIAGCSLGGLSAFDIAWEHADKIDKVGVFSGSFWWRDKDAMSPGYHDDTNRIMLNKIRGSRKKPQLHYWFYTGGKEEAGDRDKDGITDVQDDTNDLVQLMKKKNIVAPNDIVQIHDPNGVHDYLSWKKQLPHFLVWAFGKK